MESILRAKVKISSKVKILKNALKKNDGYKGQKNLGWLSSFLVSLYCLKVIIVKWLNLGLQRAPENSEFAPSLWVHLITARGGTLFPPYRLCLT